MQVGPGAPALPPAVRIVHIEDSPLDAELVAATLANDGLACSVQLVDNEVAFRYALQSADVDLVICDYSMPEFSGLAALTITRTSRPDLPFIFVSGTIGEERAIEALKLGATDYVLKQRLGRLPTAVRRALAEATARKARESAERERREAEGRLRQSEAQFRAVAETIPCALFIYQGTKRVYVNQWAERITGYTREELVGGDFWDIVHPDQQEEVRARGMARQRGDLVDSLYELRLRTKSGEDRWALVSTCALEYDGRPAALGTAVDITDRKRAEAALLRQASSLAQTEKLAAMGSLLAGVAHELNNPLSAVVGHSQILMRGLEGAAADRARKITAAAERCARIVKNFLALARQRPPERQKVHLKPVVEEALELVSYSLTSGGIQVSADLPSGLPAVWADPHQLHQVVVNLVTNAQHALENQPGPRRLSVAIGVQDRQTAWIEVGDNGPGIPPEIVSRIFEPFFTTKPVGEGTGLGLSLCRGIVESHGGVMRLRTEVGQGTAFRIELPTEQAQAEAPAAEVATPSPRVATRVLVVDDEAELGAMIAELLESEGHEVDVVTDGLQALERLARTRYDVVLSDLRMPGMDGPTLYEETRKRHPGQERRFVFLTGDTFTGGTGAFLERTGAPSLSKPFTLEEVERVVNDVRSAAGPA